MALLVVAYPELNKDDFDAIQAFRQTHDELYYRVVEPHFTLVFPLFDWEREAFAREVVERARGIEPFGFILRSAVLNKDAFNDYYHAFLVPDEGYGHFIRLHDRLYGEKLFPHRALQVDFIPHIGVGNSLDPMACLGMVRDWNKDPFAIAGRVTELDIVNYENDRTVTLQQIRLG